MMALCACCFLESWGPIAGSSGLWKLLWRQGSVSVSLCLFGCSLCALLTGTQPNFPGALWEEVPEVLVPVQHLGRFEVKRSILIEGKCRAGVF